MRRLALLLLLASAAPALAQSSAQRARQEAQRFLLSCKSENKEAQELCLMYQKEFVGDYVNAKTGDYDDQRNVVYFFMHGTGGGAADEVPHSVVADLVQACAWEIVIIARGDPRTGRAEQDYGREICAAAGGEGVRPVVTMRAQRIDADIRQARGQRSAR